MYINWKDVFLLKTIHCLEDRAWGVRKCDHASFDEWLIDTTS